MRKILLDKGFSGERKYKVIDQNQITLLKVSPLERLEHLKFIKESLDPFDLNIIKPLKIEVIENEVHTTYPWVNGVDARGVIGKLTTEDQIRLGKEAGHIKSMLNEKEMDKSIAWEEFMLKKIERNIQHYQSCPIKYDYGNQIIDFVLTNLHLLKNRPTVLNHDDFHCGNMMIDENMNLVVVDFDKLKYSDAYDDFAMLGFDIMESEIFASSFVKAYFNNDIPEEFWKLVTFYMAINSLNGPYWASQWNQEQVDLVFELTQILWDSTLGLTQFKPTWFKE